MPHAADSDDSIFGLPNVESLAPFTVTTPIDMFEAIKQLKDPDLLSFLQQTHPIYKERRRLWRRFGDVALNRIESADDRQAYLVRGRSELDWMFKQRVQLSSFLPETPGLLSDFTGAVFSKGARREFLKPNGKQDGDKDPQGALFQERIKTFIDSAGSEHLPLSRVAQEAAKLALVFGSVDALLDHPPEGTETPNVILYTPEQRLDWQSGDSGHFTWVKYLESRSEKPAPGQPRVRVDEYRIITAPTVDLEATPDTEAVSGTGLIMVFRVTTIKNKKTIEVMPPIDHKFPSIPIRTLYWKKLDEGDGDAWVKPLVEGDIKTFLQESDLTYSIYKHAQPLLKIWKNSNDDEDASVLKEIKLGGAFAVELDAGGEDDRNQEDIDYVVLPTGQLQLQADQIKETRQQTRRLGGNEAQMETLRGGRPESGVALAYRQAQRAKNFVQLAQNLQEWEWQLLELVASEGADELKSLSGILEVVYPDRFDQRLTDELFQDLETSKILGSPTLIKEVKKLLAARMIGDGVTADKFEEINAEIEDTDGQPGGGTQTDEGTLNAQALAIANLIRIGDFVLANSLRRLLAVEHGLDAPPDLTPEDVARAISPGPDKNTPKPLAEGGK